MTALWGRAGLSKFRSGSLARTNDTEVDGVDNQQQKTKLMTMKLSKSTSNSEREVDL